MSLRDKIPVEPLGEARWERIERGLWDKRDRGPAPAPKRRRWVYAIPVVVAAAAVALFFLWPRADGLAPVRTGDVQASVRVDGADILIAPDSVVSFRRGEDGAMDVLLESGAVDCTVAPRRTPFRVLAGEVTVSVVGTRFVVERRPEVRVSVSAGRVAVARGEAQVLLGPGESWSDAAPDAGIVGHAAIDAGVPPPVAVEGPRERAQALRQADDVRVKFPEKAAVRYRKLAQGSDKVAQRALSDLAYVQLFRLRQPEKAIASAREYARRFPRGREAPDVLWVRFEAHLDLNQRDEARAAATEYVRRYPKGDKLDRALVIANR